MRIVRFDKGGERHVGLMEDDGVLDLTAAMRDLHKGPCGSAFDSIVRLLQADAFNSKALSYAAEKAQETGHFMEGPVKLLAPIPRPGKVIALGLNYATHAKESGREAPKEPIIFCKASTAVIGPEEPVVYKRFLTRVDPEVELGVVIGRSGANIPYEQARSYIAAYTVVNDVTARDMQAEDFKKTQPWFRSKSIDTFCPTGPWLIPADELGWPLELNLEMRVNGEVRQKDNTRNLIFDPARLVAYISTLMTLEPGDIIATGTPEGMAPVQPGDVMEAEVEGIGVLRNPVVAEV